MEKELGTWRVLSPVHTDIQFQDRVPLVFRVHSFLCSQFKKKKKSNCGLSRWLSGQNCLPPNLMTELSHRVVGENSSL